MDSDFPAIVNALEAQHAELAGLLRDLTPADWARPTRCEGWDISDVVLHLAQTDEFAIASVRGLLPEAEGAPGAFALGADVDETAAAMVAQQRGPAGDEVRARWTRGTVELREVLRASDPHRRVRWVAGMLSAHTLASTRIAECWIHTGDVSEALGIAIVPTDRLFHIAWLAWRTLPYALARAGQELAGPVAFELVSPRGEPWVFEPDAPPSTVIRGNAFELCLVAARRVTPEATELFGDGPDAAAVLQLVRTYA